MSTSSVKDRKSTGRSESGNDSEQVRSAIGFSVRIKEEGEGDREFLTECVEDVIDEIDIELDGGFDVIWWRVKDFMARGVFFTDMSAKTVLRGIEDEDMTVTTPSASSILSKTKTMKALTSTVQVVDSKAARELIEQWQSGKSGDLPLEPFFRDQRAGESGADYMQAVLGKIGDTDWTDA